MATTSAPFLYSANSFGAGRRTFRTISASLVTTSATCAPAASKSVSGMPDAMPAPRATATSAPKDFSFLIVSGVAATRGSPSISRGTAIRIRASPPGLEMSVRRQSGEGENQKADHEGDIARCRRSAEQTGNRPEQANDKDRGRQKPVTHHAAGRQAEQYRHHIEDPDKREMYETLVALLVGGVVVTGSGGVFDVAVVDHGESSPSHLKKAGAQGLPQLRLKGNAACLSLWWTVAGRPWRGRRVDAQPRPRRRSVQWPH